MSHQGPLAGHRETYLPSDDPRSQDPDPKVRKRFFGKYRATVVENVDPLAKGRLILLIPDVSGTLPSNWATPCVPLAGPHMGTSFVPPPIGSSVWAEFEQGDPQKPLWVGCFWEAPATLGTMALVAGAAATPALTLETVTSGIGVSDTPTLPPGAGNVCIYTGAGAISIVMNPEGITITAPTLQILTPSFTINGAAFTVT